MLVPYCHRIANASKLCYCQSQKLYGLKILSSLEYDKSYTNTRSFQLSSHNNLTQKNDDGFFKSIVKKIPFLDVNKSRLQAAGYLLYELVADNINYEDFFVKYSLPDTFYSWFVITELHVWMLSLRAMAEGEDGRYTRNTIIQAMWSDVDTRAKKLGAANPAGVRSQVDELSEQFQAALIAYDEGLLTSDAVLASALWRRIFQHQCDDPQQLESLVLYVRKQVKVLDQISSDDFIDKRQFKFLSLNN